MSQSRIKNTGRNIAYAVMLQLVKLGLVFISRIIFVKKLGAAYLGVEGLFSNILGVLSLADLGMTTALMYSLYKPLAKKDEVKISQYINYFRKVYLAIAAFIGITGIILIPFLKYLVNLPSEMPNIYLYYVLILLSSVMSYLFVYKTTLLAADQKMYIINKYDAIFQFVLFFTKVSVLIFTNSFALYLMFGIICTFICNICKVRKTEKIYPYLKKNKNKVLPKKDRKNLFKNVYSLFFYKLGAVLQTNTDNIFISILVGTIVVGYYSNYLMIISAVATFLSLVFTSLKASVGNYIALKNKDEQLKMFNILEVYNFILVAFCSICLMTLIPDFIEICFGKDYVLSYGFLIVVVLNFYTSNIRQTLWMYRETTGIFDRTKFVTLVTSALNVIFSLIFGKLFGLIGIVGATVFSRTLYAWWKEPVIIYKEYFEKSPAPYFIKYIERVIIAIVICFIVNIICKIIPDINIYVNFIIKMIICVIVPTIIFLLMYIKSEAFIYLKNNLINLIKRRKTE